MENTDELGGLIRTPIRMAFQMQSERKIVFESITL
jgi:hypothetical protein